MNYMSSNGNVVIIDNNQVTINGERVPDLPLRKGGNSITQCNGKLFINKYEYKNGKWKRTLRALYHYYF